MKYKKRAPIATGINLTPLIDIVFLLLIFFMLTAHFVSEEAIDIELPKSEYAVEIDENRPVTVLVTNQGEFRLGSHTVAKEKLFGAVAEAIAATKKKALFIRGDKKAKLSDIVYVMDAAKAAEATSVSIQSE